VETFVAFAAFDMDRLQGDLTLRYARSGETFVGIGMGKAMSLRGRELVIDDGQELVAVYPYRDADASKLTLDTTSAVVLGCGVPGLGGRELVGSTELVVDYLRTYSMP
jgi:DNA/RNA-binding domain of Phe-tRNA-synthetase-like protein